MKFYKITTTHTQNEIDRIIMSMSKTEVDSIMKLYEKIQMVEYTNERGFECMFAIIDDYFISKLDEVYQYYSIRYKKFDLTKDVIMDNKITTRYKNQYNRSVQKDISELILDFKSNWITKDDILDKIIEKGIDSLSELDLKILNS